MSNRFWRGVILSKAKNLMWLQSGLDSSVPAFPQNDTLQI